MTLSLKPIQHLILVALGLTALPVYSEHLHDAINIETATNNAAIQSQNKMDFDIEIDGGINFDNNKLAIEAGANILVSGTTVFKNNNGNIKKNIDLLKSS